MAYVGIQTQIKRNTVHSILLLIGFPILLIFVGGALTQSGMGALIFLLLSLIWLAIAYKFNTGMMRWATGARKLERKENPRVYNLLENLCISQGISMPALQVIEDHSLNAFASGVRPEDYTITVSRGMLDLLNDEELEGVLAHELAHIINKDVRLLIISIIFVGIFSFIAQVIARRLYFTNRKNGIYLILTSILIAVVAYALAQLIRLGISRKREYMADAGAAEMTKRPWALASALKKISGDSEIEAVKQKDVTSLFIHMPRMSIGGVDLPEWFSTHPSIEKRIRVLEQF